MNDEEFLEQGLNDYVEAKQTIDGFEKMLAASLKEAVKNLELKQLKKIKRGNPTPGKDDRNGYWLSVTIKGKAPKYGDVEIDCGIWWRNSEPTGPILYAHFYKPVSKINFARNNKKNEVKIFDDGCGFDYPKGTYLFLPVPKPLKINQPLNQLLESLLQQLH